eukprot:4790564-Pyramimonas_sp.AAC.1
MPIIEFDQKALDALGLVKAQNFKLVRLPSRSTAPSPPGLTSATWNARALFHHDPATKTSKLQYLRQLLKGFNIVATQESHGSEDD